ncbi:hypothetical protein AB6A40_010986 [Gnathostoma spinigerum]|uniref:Uncharacterized protein n=1 Tax=Gnathostoma spinigerum TaxID=75299 RepID=A0ABD6F3R4_9BILA
MYATSFRGSTVPLHVSFSIFINFECQNVGSTPKGRRERRRPALDEIEMRHRGYLTREGHHVDNAASLPTVASAPATVVNASDMAANEMIPTQPRAQLEGIASDDFPSKIRIVPIKQENPESK